MLDISEQAWGNVDSPWISANMEVWGDLVRDQPIYKYPAGHDIFWQEKDYSSVYIVTKGRVCISIQNPDGMQKHLYIACPGAMFGEIACILGTAHVTTATAIVHTECYSLPSKELQGRIRSDSRFAELLLQYEARKNRLLISQNAMLTFDKANQRIAKILLCLADTYGEDVPGGRRLNIRFTHTDVAAITNTSRVTVNNTIRSYITAGILEKQGSAYVIRDREQLQNIAFTMI